MEILSVLKQSIVITLFVLSMMLIIDFINVMSKGNWSKGLQNSPAKQVLFGALLGVIPGCLGAYTAVSLYVHNIFGIGALAATMIATSGDEAFMMFSVIPKTAFLLQAALFLIAIVTGFIINKLVKNKAPRYPEKHFHIHKEEPTGIQLNPQQLIQQIRHITPQRIIIATALILSIVFISLDLGHTEHEMASHNHHAELLEHDHPAWITITFLVVLSVTLLISLLANDHFLKEHLIGHIVKKHFVRIFVWTFFTLLLVHFLDHYLNLEELIGENIFIVLIIAVLIGIIPESGPHFVFIILFASGALPLSILLANSIVQDGHGSLPLLAESRRGFVIIKAINLLVGLVVGFIGLSLGF